MIQMTLIQIDNYGPWTVTPRPRTESDLHSLQDLTIYWLSQMVLTKKTT